MRVAYVCADLGIPVFGKKGCSIHVQEVMRGLQKQGCDVELLASRLGGIAPPDLGNIVVHQLPNIPKGEISIREKMALGINNDLVDKLENLGNLDFIYERYSLWSYGAMEFAQKKGIFGLLEVNSPLIAEQVKYRGLIDIDGAEKVAEKVFQAATAVITVSEEVRKYVMNYVESDKIYVIPNGVNPERFSNLNYSTKSENFTVGFVGTLKPWHGLSILSEAFFRLHQKIPQARLLIVGDGPERENIEKELSVRGLDSYTQFTGAVDPEQVPELLAKMDVAVAPYPPQTDFYFSPLKVYEYMAAGLPVVVSKIGQLVDLIEPEINGIFCPPGDAIALADALEKLWRSPILRQNLGQAARQKVMKYHTWDTIAKEILQIAKCYGGVKG
ncbi:glycosyltransferase family 4 protein [Sphaerospermopsis torques-reginae]|uniref:Glycosyltransferase family 4 protein n=1 Tax=Sphaerospermopsis torques-reginae ITEP-024 TaxID=984208 RepID=A0ABX8WUI5_9CYAN|nr:glycosyltransferase family 4 protein [Sphaerospermopsis torques-reginae]QYX30052.1 glycosyltransferase family 4 protein [Sphaerospermopsis torques-reginae ITEP-024]